MQGSRFFAICALIMPMVAEAASTTGVINEVLIRGSTSWDGARFDYPEGTAELTVTRITLPAGETLPWHCHPMPLAGVLTRGKLTVTKPNGDSILVNAGDGLIEVSRQWHRGHAEEDVEIIVVYAGVAGQPLGFGQNAEPGLAELCR